MVAVTASSAAHARPAAGQPVMSGRTNPRKLEFLRDSSTGRVVVRTTDTVTGKVRCIPPETLLATMASIRRAIGLLLDREM